MVENQNDIQILPSDVIDQIAAGEVVERPSHLVKELVENSLDAGALEVSIEVNLGGREVRVTDNGRGIPPHQIPLALARHATSKLRNSDDLSRLRSFGFRGEALASIAAVSLLKIRSRTEKSELATQIECVFGKTSDAIEVGATRGTQVDVQDLFANVPARLKFLKSEAAECAAIRQSIKALALAHPHVSFHYRENGKIVLVYDPAKTRLERARQVLQIKDLYEGFCEGQGIQVHSVFCDPHHPNKTNKNLWVLAQDRWVQDRGVVAAIMEAYRNYLMGGEYPSCVVWVSVDPEEIDVNIHPSKSQVKFLDSSKVFRAVSASIRQVLETAPWNRQQSVDSQGASKQLNQPQIQQQQIAFSDNESRSFAKKYLAANMDFEKRGSQSVHLSNPTVQDFKTAVASRDVFISDLTSEQTNHLNQSQSQSQSDSLKSKTFTSDAKGKWQDLDIVGQLNLTYIVCQDHQQMILVDQHAAHERIAFERLMSAWKGGSIDIQEFLFPLVVDLSPEKVEALLLHAAEFERLGIGLESMGPQSIGVKSAPSLLKDRVFPLVLERASHEILEFGKAFSLDATISDLCATMACHSVVRAGQALSHDEMKALLQEMDEFPQSSFCPHGRPVSVKYSFSQIEREFGRSQ